MTMQMHVGPDIQIASQSDKSKKRENELLPLREENGLKRRKRDFVKKIVQIAIYGESVCHF